MLTEEQIMVRFRVTGNSNIMRAQSTKGISNPDCLTAKANSLLPEESDTRANSKTARWKVRAKSSIKVDRNM
jgi:hypothetical protein